MVRDGSDETNDRKNDPFELGRNSHSSLLESHQIDLGTDIEIIVDETHRPMSYDKLWSDKAREIRYRYAKDVFDIAQSEELKRKSAGFSEDRTTVRESKSGSITRSSFKRAIRRQSDTGTQLRRGGKRKVSGKPPQLADSIICLFLPKEESKVVLGDLTEDYKKLRVECGVAVAKVWYWRQAIFSVWPVLQPILLRVVKFVGAIIGAEEFIRRIIR